jgi:threonine dehydrogenase-like Zn-dependent dehydrogenase
MRSAQAAAVTLPRAMGRAAVVTGPGRVELRNVQFDPPPPDSVLVRLEGCGVCGSNLPLWEGRQWFDYPQPAGAPGHEGWGIVQAVGNDVASVQPGTRVAMLSSHAFAEYDIAAADAVVPVPPSLDGMPFPGEALGCAMNVFRRSDVQPGQTVAIIGIGFLGALLTQLASQAGARVIAVSRRNFALEVARRCGAAESIPLDDHQRVIAAVADLTGGRFCERTIEVTGMQWPLDLAGELTMERGRLVIAGFHQDGPRQVNLFLWNWRGLDVINAHERDPAEYVRGMRDAISAVEAGVLDPSPLYTHEFELDRTAEALEAIRLRPDGFLKALVRA